MKRVLLTISCIILAVSASTSDDENARTTEGNIVTAVDLLQDIYQKCLQERSFSCVKPKILAFLSTSMSKDKIRLTRDLSIVSSDSSTSQDTSSIWNEISNISELDGDKKEKLRLLALDKLDEFLHNHELRIRIPKEISSGELPVFVPKILTKNLPEEIKLPLLGDAGDQVARRSKNRFLRRMIMPFLIGLKFKATTLVPLAFALIALMTWKALTLGLLSIVLSGAMVLFKFTKPKVNYEVIHYPPTVPVFETHSHVPHVHEYPHAHEYPHVHEYPHAHEYPHTHEYPQGHGRQLTAQELAYGGQL